MKTAPNIVEEKWLMCGTNIYLCKVWHDFSISCCHPEQMGAHTDRYDFLSEKGQQKKERWQDLAR